MASMTAAAVAVPSFCGLRAEQAAVVSSSPRVAMAPVAARPVAVRASSESVLSKISKVALAGVATTVLLAGSANAATITMGTDGGKLRFVPESVEVAAGEEITFVNNKGYPHNINFDDDNVPEGVDTDDINSEYLNAPGQVYTVSLKTPGTYGYWCAPHKGDGMVGTIIVK